MNMKKYTPISVVTILVVGILSGLVWLCNEEYNKIEQAKIDEAVSQKTMEDLKQRLADEEARVYKNIAARCDSLGGIAVKTMTENKFSFICLKNDAIIK